MAGISVDLDGIPMEMRETARWILWVVSKKLRADGSEYLTKVPVNTDGRPIDATDEKNWMPYAAVVYHHAKGKGNLGWALAAPYLGVDLDGCRRPSTDKPTEGVVSKAAFEVVKALDSYTEISVSGTGLHVVCRGRLPEGSRTRWEQEGGWRVEAYDHGRFFTVTGQSTPWMPRLIDDRQAEIDAMIARLEGQAPRQAPSVRSHVATGGEMGAWLDTVDVQAAASVPEAKLAALLENDPKFAATWRRQRRATLPDKTASGYCLAIANFLVAAEWDRQEIYNALRFWRIAQGEDLKRPDWYARTCLLAETGKAAREAGDPPAITPVAAATPEDHGPATATTNGTSPEAPGGPPLNGAVEFGTLYGLNVLRFVARPFVDHTQFRLYIEGEMQPWIEWKGGIGLASQTKWIALHVGATGRLAAKVKGKEWNRRLDLLLSGLEREAAIGECTEDGIVRSLVEEYLQSCPPQDGHADGFSLPDCVAAWMPFRATEGTWISATEMRRWALRTHKGEKIEPSTVVSVLKHLGATHKVFSCPRSSRGYWLITWAAE